MSKIMSNTSIAPLSHTGYDHRLHKFMHLEECEENNLVWILCIAIQCSRVFCFWEPWSPQCPNTSIGLQRNHVTLDKWRSHKSFLEVIASFWKSLTRFEFSIRWWPLLVFCVVYWTLFFFQSNKEFIAQYLGKQCTIFWAVTRGSFFSAHCSSTICAHTCTQTHTQSCTSRKWHCLPPRLRRRVCALGSLEGKGGVAMRPTFFPLSIGSVLYTDS